MEDFKGFVSKTSHIGRIKNKKQRCEFKSDTMGNNKYKLQILISARNIKASRADGGSHCLVGLRY